MADEDRIENETPEDEEEGDEEDEEVPPEEVVNLLKLHEDLKAEVKRIKVQKRTIVGMGRSNQLGVADLAGEVYDELESMQQQMIALTELAAAAIDSALQWCGDLSDHTGFGEDEDEGEDEEGEGESFLTHSDAALIGTILIRTAAAATQSEHDASVVDWKALREQLDVAIKRVSEIEDKEPIESPAGETTN
jgi:hypothetical protein